MRAKKIAKACMIGSFECGERRPGRDPSLMSQFRPQPVVLSEGSLPYAASAATGDSKAALGGYPDASLGTVVG